MTEKTPIGRQMTINEALQLNIVVVVGKATAPCLRLAGVFASVSRPLRSGSVENLDALGSWCQEGSKMYFKFKG